MWAWPFLLNNTWEGEIMKEYIGDHKKGEIEIITNPVEIESLSESNNLGVVYSDEYIKVQKDPVIFPNGKRGTYIRVMPQKMHNGNAGSAVIGVFNGKILLFNIFRHSIRQYSLEIPRGFAKEGSDVSKAIREIRETGFEPRSIELIGYVHPDTGLLSSRVSVYYAELFIDLRGISPDDGPINEQNFYSIEEVKRLIREGVITDSFTLSALALAMMKGYL